MANETIRIYRNGTLVRTAAADATGRADVALDTTGWSLGRYTITVTAEDTAAGLAESLPSVGQMLAIGPLWADDFARPDGPVGNGWIQGADAGAVGVIVNGDLVRTDSGAYRTLVNPADGVLPQNVLVQMTVPHSMLSLLNWGVAARCAADGTNGAWVMQMAGIGIGSSSGTPSVTGGFPASWAVDQDHTIGLRVVGSTATILLDGAEYGTFPTTATGTSIAVVGDGGNGQFIVRDLTATVA